MDRYITDNNVVQIPGVEWVALLFFVAAWYLNRRLEGNNWSPWVVLPIAIMGSLMWYASAWSANISGGISGILSGIGAPASTVMGVICLLALVGTIADLLIDATYNIAAVWALIVAPVAAHGAGGFVGGFVREGVYGGLTLWVWGSVGELFGG